MCGGSHADLHVDLLGFMWIYSGIHVASLILFAAPIDPPLILWEYTSFVHPTNGTLACRSGDGGRSMPSKRPSVVLMQQKNYDEEDS